MNFIVLKMQHMSKVCPTTIRIQL